MKRILTVSFLLLVASPSFAQHSSKAYLILADSLYRNHHYQVAADYYEKALKKSVSSGEIMLQVAKCYNKINLLSDAEKWFIRAKSNRAPFSNEDTFEFAEVLISLKKNKKADSVLEHLLQQDPNAHLVRKALDDLRDSEKYYKDSSSVNIASLSVNTTVAEFSPAFYKEGLVFSSAKQENLLGKKFQWDNSPFLNLYFIARTGPQAFTEPRFFEEGLNTSHHDGPVSFYHGYQKMIINRNQRLKVEGREDVYEWRPGLYDGQFNATKSKWEVTPLPFNDAAHSYAHPSISEDGNVLYFISDKPGGFGGTDIYRVTRVNEIWGTPFNLGPAINTPGNEAFPFFIENTLYFASDGTGGLGGLDIFISTQTINGFTPPVNVGYPINSTDDDFSLITEDGQQTGYFASSRNGNDDLFSFQRIAPKVNIVAHIFDGNTKAPLAGASIEIITTLGTDVTLNADSLGDFSFKLPLETAYLVIGNKNNMIGMVSDVAKQRNEIQQIAAYGDTTTLACIGIITNEQGLPKNASVIQITDQTTGTLLNHPADQSIIIFQGEKGHNYLIEIKDEAGRQTSHKLSIAQHDRGIKRWPIILSDTLPALKMAARIFRADNNQPLANANVKIITFSENDQELTADASGIVDFSLMQGTAYVVIGSKDDFTGMHSGSADKGTDKKSVIHPVPAFGDRTLNVLTMGLITNSAGELVEGHSIVITNKTTGENIPADTKKGLITFQAKRGDVYNISVSHDLHKTVLQKLVIPTDATEAEKFTVALENKIEGKEKINPFVAATDYNSISTRIPGEASLLFVDAEDGSFRSYIVSGDSLNEISQENNNLFLANRNGKQNLGNGTLSKLKADPSSILKGQTHTANLRNIYFDFDKDNLDVEDIAQLLLVKKILDHDQSLQLKVAGHADDRGQINYNLALSERRAGSVTAYLVSQGIDENRIAEKGFGESQPVGPCNRADCSEKEHQRNRRAEFVISKKGMKEFEKKEALSASRKGHERNSKKYELLLKNFSETKVEGVLFKITVGAYKKQPNLSFPELSDLGKIESVVSTGITYYYLSDFTTLKKAEEIRHEVIRRGVKGASISVYQNGDKISLNTYSGLLN